MAAEVDAKVLMQETENKEESRYIKTEQYDRIVDKYCPNEFQKIEGGFNKLPQATENLTFAENKQPDCRTGDTLHSFNKSNYEMSEGDSFLESPSAAEVVYNYGISAKNNADEMTFGAVTNNLDTEKNVDVIEELSRKSELDSQKGPHGSELDGKDDPNVPQRSGEGVETEMNACSENDVTHSFSSTDDSPTVMTEEILDKHGSGPVTEHEGIPGIGIQHITESNREMKMTTPDVNETNNRSDPANFLVGETEGHSLHQEGNSDSIKITAEVSDIKVNNGEADDLAVRKGVQVDGTYKEKSDDTVVSPFMKKEEKIQSQNEDLAGADTSEAQSSTGEYGGRIDKERRTEDEGCKSTGLVPEHPLTEEDFQKETIGHKYEDIETETEASVQICRKESEEKPDKCFEGLALQEAPLEMCTVNESTSKDREKAMNIEEKDALSANLTQESNEHSIMILMENERVEDKRESFSKSELDGGDMLNKETDQAHENPERSSTYIDKRKEIHGKGMEQTCSEALIDKQEQEHPISLPEENSGDAELDEIKKENEMETSNDEYRPEKSMNENERQEKLLVFSNEISEESDAHTLGINAHQAEKEENNNSIEEKLNYEKGEQVTAPEDVQKKEIKVEKDDDANDNQPKDFKPAELIEGCSTETSLPGKEENLMEIKEVKENETNMEDRHSLEVPNLDIQIEAESYDNAAGDNARQAREEQAKPSSSVQIEMEQDYASNSGKKNDMESSVTSTTEQRMDQRMEEAAPDAETEEYKEIDIIEKFPKDTLQENLEETSTLKLQESEFPNAETNEAVNKTSEENGSIHKIMECSSVTNGVDEVLIQREEKLTEAEYVTEPESLESATESAKVQGSEDFLYTKDDFEKESKSAEISGGENREITDHSEIYELNPLSEKLASLGADNTEEESGEGMKHIATFEATEDVEKDPGSNLEEYNEPEKERCGTETNAQITQMLNGHAVPSGCQEIMQSSEQSETKNSGAAEDPGEKSETSVAELSDDSKDKPADNLTIVAEESTRTFHERIFEKAGSCNDMMDSAVITGATEMTFRKEEVDDMPVTASVKYLDMEPAETTGNEHIQHGEEIEKLEMDKTSSMSTFLNDQKKNEEENLTVQYPCEVATESRTTSLSIQEYDPTVKEFDKSDISLTVENVKQAKGMKDIAEVLTTSAFQEEGIVSADASTAEQSGQTTKMLPQSPLTELLADEPTNRNTNNTEQVEEDNTKEKEMQQKETLEIPSTVAVEGTCMNEEDLRKYGATTSETLAEEAQKDPPEEDEGEGHTTNEVPTMGLQEQAGKTECPDTPLASEENKEENLESKENPALAEKFGTTSTVVRESQEGEVSTTSACAVADSTTFQKVTNDCEPEKHTARNEATDSPQKISNEKVNEEQENAGEKEEVQEHKIKNGKEEHESSNATSTVIEETIPSSSSAKNVEATSVQEQTTAPAAKCEEISHDKSENIMGPHRNENIQDSHSSVASRESDNPNAGFKIAENTGACYDATIGATMTAETIENGSKVCFKKEKVQEQENAGEREEKQEQKIEDAEDVLEIPNATSTIIEETIPNSSSTENVEAKSVQEQTRVLSVECVEISLDKSENFMEPQLHENIQGYHSDITSRETENPDAGMKITEKTGTCYDATVGATLTTETVENDAKVCVDKKEVQEQENASEKDEVQEHKIKDAKELHEISNATSTVVEESIPSSSLAENVEATSIQEHTSALTVESEEISLDKSENNIEPPLNENIQDSRSSVTPQESENPDASMKNKEKTVTCNDTTIGATMTTETLEDSKACFEKEEVQEQENADKKQEEQEYKLKDAKEVHEISNATSTAIEETILGSSSVENVETTSAQEQTTALAAKCEEISPDKSENMLHQNIKDSHCYITSQEIENPDSSMKIIEKNGNCCDATVDATMTAEIVEIDPEVWLEEKKVQEQENSGEKEKVEEHKIEDSKEVHEISDATSTAIEETIQSSPLAENIEATSLHEQTTALEVECEKISLDKSENMMEPLLHENIQDSHSNVTSQETENPNVDMKTIEKTGTCYDAIVGATVTAKTLENGSGVCFEKEELQEQENAGEKQEVQEYEVEDAKKVHQISNATSTAIKETILGSSSCESVETTSAQEQTTALAAECEKISPDKSENMMEEMLQQNIKDSHCDTTSQEIENPDSSMKIIEKNVNCCDATVDATMTAETVEIDPEVWLEEKKVQEQENSGEKEMVEEQKIENSKEVHEISHATSTVIEETIPSSPLAENVEAASLHEQTTALEVECEKISLDKSENITEPLLRENILDSHSNVNSRETENPDVGMKTTEKTSTCYDAIVGATMTAETLKNGSEVCFAKEEVQEQENAGEKQEVQEYVAEDAKKEHQISIATSTTIEETILGSSSVENVETTSAQEQTTALAAECEEISPDKSEKMMEEMLDQNIKDSHCYITSQKIENPDSSMKIIEKNGHCCDATVGATMTAEIVEIDSEVCLEEKKVQEQDNSGEKEKVEEHKIKDSKEVHEISDATSTVIEEAILGSSSVENDETTSAQEQTTAVAAECEKISPDKSENIKELLLCENIQNSHSNVTSPETENPDVVMKTTEKIGTCYDENFGATMTAEMVENNSKVCLQKQENADEKLEEQEYRLEDAKEVHKISNATSTAIEEAILGSSSVENDETTSAQEQTTALAAECEKISPGKSENMMEEMLHQNIRDSHCYITSQEIESPDSSMKIIEKNGNCCDATVDATMTAEIVEINSEVCLEEKKVQEQENSSEKEMVEEQKIEDSKEVHEVSYATSTVIEETIPSSPLAENVEATRLHEQTTSLKAECEKISLDKSENITEPLLCEDIQDSHSNVTSPETEHPYASMKTIEKTSTGYDKKEGKGEEDAPKPQFQEQDVTKMKRAEFPNISGEDAESSTHIEGVSDLASEKCKAKSEVTAEDQSRDILTGGPEDAEIKKLNGESRLVNNEHEKPCEMEIVKVDSSGGEASDKEVHAVFEKAGEIEIKKNIDAAAANTDVTTIHKERETGSESTKQSEVTEEKCLEESSAFTISKCESEESWERTATMTEDQDEGQIENQRIKEEPQEQESSETRGGVSCQVSQENAQPCTRLDKESDHMLQKGAPECQPHESLKGTVSEDAELKSPNVESDPADIEPATIATEEKDDNHDEIREVHAELGKADESEDTGHTIENAFVHAEQGKADESEDTGHTIENSRDVIEKMVGNKSPEVVANNAVLSQERDTCSESAELTAEKCVSNQHSIDQQEPNLETEANGNNKETLNEDEEEGDTPSKIMKPKSLGEVTETKCASSPKNSQDNLGSSTQMEKVSNLLAEESKNYEVTSEVRSFAEAGSHYGESKHLCVASEAVGERNKITQKETPDKEVNAELIQFNDTEHLKECEKGKSSAAIQIYPVLTRDTSITEEKDISSVIVEHAEALDLGEEKKEGSSVHASNTDVLEKERLHDEQSSISMEPVKTPEEDEKEIKGEAGSFYDNRDAITSTIVATEASSLETQQDEEHLHVRDPEIKKTEFLEAERADTSWRILKEEVMVENTTLEMIPQKIIQFEDREKDSVAVQSPSEPVHQSEDPGARGVDIAERAISEEKLDATETERESAPAIAYNETVKSIPQNGKLLIGDKTTFETLPIKDPQVDVRSQTLANTVISDEKEIEASSQCQNIEDGNRVQDAIQFKESLEAPVKQKVEDEDSQDPIKEDKKERSIPLDVLKLENEEKEREMKAFPPSIEHEIESNTLTKEALIPVLGDITRAYEISGDEVNRQMSEKQEISEPNPVLEEVTEERYCSDKLKEEEISNKTLPNDAEPDIRNQESKTPARSIMVEAPIFKEEVSSAENFQKRALLDGEEENRTNPDGELQVKNSVIVPGGEVIRETPLCRETVVSTDNENASQIMKDRFSETLEKYEGSKNLSEVNSALEQVQQGEGIGKESSNENAKGNPMSAGTSATPLSDLLQKTTEDTLQMVKDLAEKKETTKAEMEVQKWETEAIEHEGTKTDEERDESGEDESIEAETGQDTPILAEKSKDVDIKVPHKKSHNILSGVGSKVKHSISKVKKVITGKSSHSKTAHSPK